MVDYIINLTDPESSTFVIKPYTSDGYDAPTVAASGASSIGANTSLLLYGKGHPNYGERTDENLIHIMENFAGASQPLNPLPGQLWFSRRLYWRDTSGAPDWYRWDGSSWVVVSVSESSSSPALPVDGDYWYDTTNLVLKRYFDDERFTFGWNDNDCWFTESNSAPTSSDSPEEVLRVWNGSTWGFVNSGVAQDFEPQDATDGALWFDTSSNVLKVYVASGSPIGWMTTTASFDHLSELLDVNIPSPSTDDLLEYDGSFWVAQDTRVKRSGDTMTGSLTLSADPVNPLEAATKDYVDTEVASAIISGSTTDVYVNSGTIYESYPSPINVGLGSGTLVLGYAGSIGSPPTPPSDLLITGFVVNASELTYDGYTTSVDTIPSGNTKDAIDYLADSRLYKSGDSMTGDLDMGFGTFVVLPSDPVLDDHAVRLGYLNTNYYTQTDADTMFVDVSGDTMTGDLNMNLSSIIGLPVYASQNTDPSSATSKDYVDTVSKINEINNRVVNTSGSGSPAVADTTFTAPLFTAGTNSLLVTVNGIKAIKNEPAEQIVFFSAQKINSSLITTMDVHNVTFIGDTFTVDGLDVSSLYTVGDVIRARDISGSPIVDTDYTILSITPTLSPLSTDIQVTIPITGTPTQIGRIFDATVNVNASGSHPIVISSYDVADFGKTFGGLVQELSNQMQTSPFTDFASAGMFVLDGNMHFSPLLAGTQTISIVDGIGNPTTRLFASLNDFSSIGPAFPGILYSSGSPPTPAFFGYDETAANGATSTSITFNSSIPVGDIVEIINYK